MEKRRSPAGLLRAPLGHWAVAVLFALAVALALRAWLEHQAVQTAQTATLSWDAAVARHQDPGLADTADPAVAMAQSILSDSVVDGLAQSASVPLNARATRIGEFRSRLQLRQPSATLLQVQFRDDNSERAEKATNAVAGSLTAQPSAPAETPAAVAPHPIETPPALQAKPSAPAPATPSTNVLAQSLGKLDTELSAAEKRVDSLSSETWDRKEHAGEPSSYRQSKQQQLLTAQVGTSLKEVADWRADPANAGAARESLRRIQDALLSVWPASRAYKGSRDSAVLRGFNAAGVDTGRLREERAQFAHAVEVVHKEKEAVQRQEPAASAPPPVSPASESSATAPADAPAVPTPPIAESEIPKSSTESPFRLLHPAGEPVRAPVWPAALAGVCGGLVYLGAAAFRHKEDEVDEEYADDGAVETQRLITPAKPLRPAEFFANADPHPAEIAPRPAARFAEVAARPAEVDPHPAEVALPPPRIEAPDPPPSAPEADPPEIVIAAEDQRLPFREVDEEAGGDPWVNNIIKGLSETSIGRMFESQASKDQQENRDSETDRHPDRLAG
jgi:hypothetical protein